MGFIWSLIVEELSAIAGAITNKGSSDGANVVAGLVGSALGQALLGSWGPVLQNGNRAIIDWCHHFSTNRIILCSKTVKRLLKEVVAVLHQVIRTAKQNNFSYFSFGWAYYRRCKLLNTVLE